MNVVLDLHAARRVEVVWWGLGPTVGLRLKNSNLGTDALLSTIRFLSVPPVYSLHLFCGRDHSTVS